jgi:O-antigen/teichoic acid export membrane protein
MLKIILSNTLAQLTAKFFGAGLTLLTTYFTIRLTGLDLYGDLTKILVLIAVGFTAIDFGLNAEGIRSSTSKLEMQKTTRAIILTRLLLSIIVIIVLNLVIIVLPGGYSVDVKKIFWLGSLAIIFQGIYTSSNVWFQYQLSYWRSTISVVFGSIIGTLLTLYYLNYSPTLAHLIFANTIGYLSMAISSILLLCTSGAIAPEKCLQKRSVLGGPSSQFENLTRLQKLCRKHCGQGIYDLRFILPLLRRSLILGLILIASVLVSKIDTIVLGIFTSSREVGEYGFAYRIFDVILVLPVFVMNTIYPISVKELEVDKKSNLIKHTIKSMGIIGIFVSIVLWLFAPYVNLVKPGLVVTTEVLRILAYSLPLFYITAPLMWSLISKKKDKLVLGIYAIAALLNLFLNLIFIPSYGATASAWNTGATELFIFIALLYFSKNI